jgi:hypothetical protein
MTTKPRNDRNAGVTKFCKSLEDHRRTDAGRVKTPKEFVEFFFPYDASKSEDRVFKSIPKEVRGPVISGWGIRGTKSALKDDDERVQSVVHDAMIAGDVDDNMFEEGVSSEILIDWIALQDWWAFWRSGRITGAPVQRALATARELALFDDRWFLDNLRGRGGRLSGSDVVCDTLPKDQIIGWIRNIHGSGDGSPAGLVAALGWEVILAKTSQEALLYALDAFAQKVGLVVAAPKEPAPEKSGEGEVAIPDFSTDLPAADPSTMADGNASAGDWPEAPFPAPPAATYGMADEADEITSERKR